MKFNLSDPAQRRAYALELAISALAEQSMTSYVEILQASDKFLAFLENR